MKFMSAAGSACAIALSVFAFTACNPENPGRLLGTDNTTGSVLPIPGGNDGVASGSGNGSGATLGKSCHTGDPTHICLGLKYVVYKDSSGTPTVSQADAITDVENINNVWAQCNIAFQIDRFLAVNPSDNGLVYRTANLGDLDTIRSVYGDDSTLLVTTTGTWNRAGTLGNTGANAWTNMPGGGPYGVVLEKPVGTYPNIIAHELGHYLSLDHVSDQGDLMNPVIYTGSVNLYASQCSASRSAANYYWSRMQR